MVLQFNENNIHMTFEITDEKNIYLLGSLGGSLGTSDQCRQVKEQPGNMHKSHVK